jgi:hypothetical protein
MQQQMSSAEYQKWLAWEKWQHAMREFQADVQKAEGG